MTLQVSTEFKSLLLARMPDIFNGGHIRVFSGGRPDTADGAENANGGVLLGYVTQAGLDPTLPGSGLQFGASGPYVANDPFQNWVLVPLMSATVTWFRVVGPALDDGGASYVLPRLDGAISDLAGTGEMRLPSTTLVAGTMISPISFFYTIPPIIG